MMIITIPFNFIAIVRSLISIFIKFTFSIVGCTRRSSVRFPREQLILLISLYFLCAKSRYFFECVGFGKLFSKCQGDGESHRFPYIEPHSFFIPRT